ncbi:MAG: caspase family protein, partial [Rubrivivax sp.]|nr:caspase family protein [Rubrivivax sp.]
AARLAQSLTTVRAMALTLAQRVQAAVPTNVVTVLYRRESPQAPSRLEPAVQAATLALEREFINRGFRVIQPTAQVYGLLDQGNGVVVTFAEDAGFSLVYSAYADVRPVPGQEAGIAELRLSTRIFVGRHILVADEGRGQMFTRLEPHNREFGMRRALELAANRAAADLAGKASAQLQQLTPERINQLVGAKPTSATTAQVVPVPAPGAPLVAPGTGSSPGMPVAPPPLAPPPGLPTAPPPLAPAPAPVAPAPVAPLPATPSMAAELPAPRKRFALVVGMADYSSVRAAGINGISDLAGVEKDTRFVLNSLPKMGFSGDNITVLRNREATGAAVRNTIKTFAGRVGADDLVMIFIAGHGASKEASVSGFGMPILADFRPGDPNALDFWELQSYIKNLRGRVVWINDTCHSGGAAQDVSTVVVSASGVTASKDVRGPEASSVASDAGRGQDFAILTACNPSELSLENAEGGLFTTALFRELVANQGRMPLANLFAERVHLKVVDQSQKLCRSHNICDKNTQMTPTMAYNGRGHLVRL